MVSPVLAAHEYRHYEILASGIETAEGVFHIDAPCRMVQIEGPGGVGVKKPLDNAAGLATAGVGAL